MGLLKELDALVRRVVREETAPPLFVTQRNVERVVGVPRWRYLRLAKAGAFPAAKERRLVVARTADVVSYFEGCIVRLAKGPHDPEGVALARVGARRVG